MKSFGTLGIVVAILAVLLIAGCGSYNGFVDAEENMEQSWANVETQYQRRADLIPNLVNTVKGAADFERGTLEAVTNARAKATSINIDASNLTPEAMQQFQEAQSQLSTGLGRLLATAENYPELKSNAQFQELQAQLEGTENRIAVARDRFNEEATKFNKKVRRFPGTVFATIFGFQEKPQFEAQAGASNAPEVNFN
ncbi:LemA family protein [Neolewinella lacunae]|uniref:LemA family protein n=1 Tax=Neolewinella lacunae TaxID=1517758 RepID=A0A923PKI3_9BACT|nr:LemA family protein [Neolewinella lacunae]MBC6994371.1 LemA family protein [Neolewinella lacunae]MDN3633302.1 LemA family protein [Neolewinella lacunae]